MVAGSCCRANDNFVEERKVPILAPHVESGLVNPLTCGFGDVEEDVDEGDQGGYEALADSENGLKKLVCVTVFNGPSSPVFPSKSALDTSTATGLARELCSEEVGGGGELLAMC